MKASRKFSLNASYYQLSTCFDYLHHNDAEIEPISCKHFLIAILFFSTIIRIIGVIFFMYSEIKLFAKAKEVFFSISTSTDVFSCCIFHT